MKEELGLIVEVLNKSTMSKAELYGVNIALRRIESALEDFEKLTKENGEINKEEA